MDYINIINKRRSVRTFDKNKDLDNNLLNEINDYLNNLNNPFNLKIEWKLLNSNDNKLSSPVIVGEKYYILGKIKKDLYSEVAYGYAFEELVLFLTSKGLGTTWMAGTFSRDEFEKKMELKDDEIMPCVTPLGYPAKKMSLREKLMRKGVKADTREDFNTLFFNKELNNLDDNTLLKYKNILELVQKAPSAVNKQPWRLIFDDNKIYFYKNSNKGFKHDDFDVQKVDIGIALNHFIHGLNINNINYELDFVNPNIETKELEYILTVIIK